MSEWNQVAFFSLAQARMRALDFTSVVKTYFSRCHDLRSISQVEDYADTFNGSEAHIRLPSVYIL